MNDNDGAAMHEIRRRFVRGILEGWSPDQLHAYVSEVRREKPARGR